MAGEECVICLDAFIQPKVLPCGHSCCLECLRGWIDKFHTQDQQGELRGACASELAAVVKDTKDPSCPECRHRFLLPKDGVDGLPNNISLIRATKGTVHKCGDCEEQPREFKCVECNDWLCTTCGELHRRIKATRKHRLVTFQQVQDGTYRNLVEESKPPFLACSKHPDELQKYFCIDCDEPVCTDCLNVIHVNHSRMMLEEKAQTLLQELSEDNSKRRKAMELVTSQVNFVQKITDTKPKNVSKVIQAINNRKMEINKEVDSIANELIALFSLQVKVDSLAMTQFLYCLAASLRKLQIIVKEDDLKGKKDYEIVQKLKNIQKFQPPDMITCPKIKEYSFLQENITSIKEKERENASHDPMTSKDVLKSLFGEVYVSSGISLSFPGKIK